VEKIQCRAALAYVIGAKRVRPFFVVWAVNTVDAVLLSWCAILKVRFPVPYESEATREMTGSSLNPTARPGQIAANSTPASAASTTQ
jgi:hypothetical protein